MSITSGTYKARALEYQYGVAETGTEQVAVTFEILEEGEFFGYTITWFGYFSEKTAERTIESLRICGWEGDDLNDLVGFDRNDVSLVLAEEEYDGEMRVKVKWVNRLGAGRVALKKPMDDTQKARLASKFRGLVLASKRGSSGAAAAPAAPAPSPAPARSAQNGYPEAWDQGIDRL